MSNILITGGAGFIGSHLSLELSSTGHNVIIIDNMSTGSIRNLNHIRGAVIVVDDIMNEHVMEELVCKCDCIYHLAAAVGVKLIMEKPFETINTNVRGTEIVLRLANKYKKKIMIVSTSEIYGSHDDGDVLFEDSARIMGPVTKWRWAYACSKTIDEFLSLAYYKKENLPVVIVRLFNTVGPKQSSQYGMVIPNFVKSAINNKTLHVYGDGSQVRSFTHVSDVVGAMIKLMNTDSAMGNVFNIGSNNTVSIHDLAKLIINRTGSSSKIEFVSYDVAYGEGFEDMKCRIPDISKISSAINYEPKYDLNYIIDDVISYYERDKQAS